ncbi:IclR family transcriptional regulator [Allokutzneria multivorans]|uniref:IclR family transcriptional regulator n=1 Tax=Allokutzneria multivorans TaxID=1142134 RepID=A0ABP7TS35_9PSEU
MIQSVDRAVRVLGVLHGARRISLSELSARLELPPSTVHGIVKTLVAHGMVVQDRASAQYRLGPAVLKLGTVYLHTLELRAQAAAWADDLAARTGFAVRTGVLMLDEVLVVHHSPRPDGSRQMPEVGIVIPAHACALGKASLAYLPSRARALLGDGPLRSMTAETITEPADLAAHLDQVRVDAYAVEQEEAVLGECGTAAPVFDAAGALAGAVGVVVPMSEWPPSDLVRTAVRDTARAISRELGADGWPATTA